MIQENQATTLCGIINVTPDSFSDGGHYNTVDDALKQVKRLVNDGAGMVDIGGESTRPGSDDVSIEEEIQRVVPVISAIRSYYKQLPISIDTWKSEVAVAAIQAGANCVNDITGLLGDEAMADVVAEYGVHVIVMFNATIARPHHEASQKFRQFGNDRLLTIDDIHHMERLPIVECMMCFFDKVLDRATQAGIPAKQLILDPGIGFGLTRRENWELIRQLDTLKKKGYPVLVGASRKRFIVDALKRSVNGNTTKKNEDIGSAMVSAVAASKGVDILRVHTIKEHIPAVLIGRQIAYLDKISDKFFDSYD